jgi:hypothetical protein
VRAVVTALLALLVACGSSPQATDGGPGNDGGGIDTPLDADPNVRGTVTVRVVDKSSQPLAGMYVVFIDTDTTVTEATTDANGTATASVYPGATVTAVRSRGTSYSLATVQALVPGDTVTLISALTDVISSEDPFSSRVVPLPAADIAASPNGASKSGSTATFTTVAPHGLAVGDPVVVAKVGIAGYNGTWTVASVPSTTTFTANIGSGGLANSGSLASGGATAAKALTFSVSYASYGGAERYEVRTRCGIVDAGASLSAQVALPAGCALPTLDFEVLAKTNAGATLAWTQLAGATPTQGTTLTVTDTWHAPAQLTVTYTNPTAMVTNLAVARYSPYVRGTPVAETSSAASATTTLMLTASQPQRAVMKTLVTCPYNASASCLSTASGAASQTITHAVDGTAASYAVDIGATLLPWVKALYVPSSTTLDITVTGTAAYDLFEANLRYVRGGATIYTWRVFGPTAQTLQFPTLPATAPGNPTVLPTDVMSSYQAFICESDAVGGYRKAIENVFDTLGACESTATPSLRLHGGTVNRISQWN